MRIDNVELPNGKSIEVLELSNCIVAGTAASLLKNTQFNEKEAEHLKNRFLIWVNSGEFSSGQWTKVQKTFKNYKFMAFVKGRSENNL